MQCKSCDTVIDPKWSHAIKNNVCPFCGMAIMDEVLKENLSILKELFSELIETNKQELDDWLFSNYSYADVNREDISKFLPKNLKIVNNKPSKHSDKMVEGDVIAVQDENVTNGFLQRAEVTKSLEKHNDLKSKAQKILRGEDNDSQWTEDELEELGVNPNTDSGAGLNIADMLANSKSLNGGFIADADDMSSPFANLSSSNQQNAKDLRLLRDLQNRVNGSKDAIFSGVSSSGKKASFSRS